MFAACQRPSEPAPPNRPAAPWSGGGLLPPWSRWFDALRVARRGHDEEQCAEASHATKPTGGPGDSFRPDDHRGSCALTLHGPMRPSMSVNTWRAIGWLLTIRLPVDRILLYTTGRVSGEFCRTPLRFFEVDGDLVVAASYGGSPQHPHWYLNLVEDPRVWVRGDAGLEWKPTASPIDRADRNRIRRDTVPVPTAPQFGDYQQTGSQSSHSFG